MLLRRDFLRAVATLSVVVSVPLRSVARTKRVVIWAEQWDHQAAVMMDMGWHVVGKHEASWGYLIEHVGFGRT